MTQQGKQQGGSGIRGPLGKSGHSEVDGGQQRGDGLLGQKGKERGWEAGLGRRTLVGAGVLCVPGGGSREQGWTWRSGHSQLSVQGDGNSSLCPRGFKDPSQSIRTQLV